MFHLLVISSGHITIVGNF